MSKLEKQVITKLFEEQDASLINSSQLREIYFSGFERRAFQVIKEFLLRGYFPSRDILSDRGIESEIVPSTDSLSTLTRRLQEEVIRREANEKFQQIQYNLRDNPWKALESILSMGFDGTLATLHDTPSPPPVQASVGQIRADYERNVALEGMVGYEYPWELLNNQTGGLENGTLVVVYGLKKHMKTWVLLCMAEHLMDTHDLPILFMSAEMSVKKMEHRFASIFSRIDYSAFRKGTLQNPREFYEDLDALSECSNVFFDTTRSFGVKAVFEMRKKCLQHKVKAAFFDSVHLIGKDWKELKEITSRLKHLSMELDIPIVISAQANRKSSEYNTQDMGSEVDMAHSLSFTQDCDLSIRARLDKAANTIELSMPDFREGKTYPFYINAIPSTDFTQRELVDDEEMVELY